MYQESIRLPPAIAGFFEGLLAPLGEILIAVVIGVSLATVSAVSTVSSSAGFGVPSVLNVTWLVALIPIIDIIRNVALGLSASSFAAGSLAGNSISLFIFYGAMAVVAPDSVVESIILVIILAVSYALGVILWFKRHSDN